MRGVKPGMFLIIYLILVIVVEITFEIGSPYFLMAIGSSIGLYKGITTKEFKDVFNFTKITYSLREKERKIELLASFLAAFTFSAKGFLYFSNIWYFLLDKAFFVLFSLFVYRFLMYGILKKE